MAKSGKILQLARRLAEEKARSLLAQASACDQKAQEYAERAASLRAEAEAELAAPDRAAAEDCCDDPSKPPCSPCEERRKKADAHAKAEQPAEVTS